MAHAAGTKVLMIGLDAGDLELIRSSLDELPRLRALLESGSLHPLQSPADLLTSAVWPTFATGTGPGEHGVYYPMQWDPASMQLRRVSADWISFEPFWYDLARQGLRVTVLDVPFSLPSRLEQGIEVMNWGSQECLGPFQANRPDILRTIRRRFGLHPMGEDVPVEPTVSRLERQRRALVSGARKKGELARWLMQETDWDLFVTVFAEPHRGGHLLWPNQSGSGVTVPDGALREVYRAVDDAVGHVVDGAGPDTAVIVFSTHGMGPNYTQEHFAPTVVDRVNTLFRGGEIAQTEPEPERRSPMRMLREAVPGQLQYLLAKALPVAVRDWVVVRAFLGGVDWATTPGFLLPGSCESYLRLNVSGRESPGAFDLASEPHQRYARLLQDELLALQDGGAPVVREVAASAERYPGPRSHLLPDFVVLWEHRPPATGISSERLGHLEARLATGRTGDHRPDGFVVINGPVDALADAPPPEQVADLARIARSLLLSPSAG